MAVVYPADPNAPPPLPEPQHRSIFTLAGEHPVLSVLLLFGVALLAGYVIHKIMSGSSSSGSTTDTSGTSSDNGQQVLYIPTSNEFLNVTTTDDDNDSDSSMAPNPPVPAPGGTTGASMATGLHPNPPVPAPSAGPSLHPNPPMPAPGGSPSASPASGMHPKPPVPAPGKKPKRRPPIPLPKRRRRRGGGDMEVSAFPRGWGGTHGLTEDMSLPALAGMHGVGWPELYQHNQQTVDAHGGPWAIMPRGSVFWIPG